MKSILLKNASWVVKDSEEYICNGSIVVENNKIKKIGAAEEINRQYEDKCNIVKDCSGCMVTPGLINAHNHVYEIIQRGLGKDLTMEDWLRYVIYPSCKSLSGEDYYYLALLACMDLVRNGTTTVIEQLTNFARFNADHEMKAFIKFGIRGAVARGASTKSVIDESENKTADEELDACEEFLSRWNANDLVKAWLGPAGLYSCDPLTLGKLKELTNKYNRHFHIHLSETRFQQAMAEELGFEGQIMWADDVGLLDENTSAAHCVWITEKEMDVLKKRGTKVVHNPSSNQILASGFANVPLMIEKGITVAIASDGPSSNDSQDMVGEMKASVIMHRAHQLNPRIMYAKDGFRMGTEAGAKIYGNDNIGVLKEGGLADIACYRVSDNPCMLPVYNPIDALVFYGSGRDNVLTIINGVIVYDNGLFPTVNTEEVYEAVELARNKTCKVLNL